MIICNVGKTIVSLLRLGYNDFSLVVTTKLLNNVKSQNRYINNCVEKPKKHIKRDIIK